MNAHIDIGKDFSPVVGPRRKTDGPHSGEEFREKILEPAFLANEIVVVAIDSLETYSASFFEEAFGGLVRKYGYEAVSKKLRFSTLRRLYLVPKIQAWMREAAGAGEPARR